MKKFMLFLLIPIVCLWAAEFWEAKPYTEWTEKEIQKLISDSPWAHKTNVETGVVRGFGETSDGPGVAPRGGKGDGPRGGAGNPDAPGPVAEAIPITIRWQSALPMKQAMMKMRYKDEVATSPDAQKVLSREEQFYAVAVSGLPAVVAQADAQKKQAILSQATLKVKGKDPLVASDVQFGVQGRAADAYFLFDRKAALSPADKEVEFSSKIDKFNIRYKFKLDKMVYNGKLEI
jgi:hypothetical protein